MFFSIGGICIHFLFILGAVFHEGYDSSWQVTLHQIRSPPRKKRWTKIDLTWNDSKQDSSKNIHSTWKTSCSYFPSTLPLKPATVE